MYEGRSGSTRGVPDSTLSREQQLEIELAELRSAWALEVFILLIRLLSVVNYVQPKSKRSKRKSTPSSTSLSRLLLKKL